MPRLVAGLGPIEAAVVGEPTNLDLAIAQRGLLRIDLVARGRQIHAGRVASDGFVNAITTLARDLVALEGVGTGRTHPLLGDPTITPTMVEGGVSRNVTAPVARACLDVRTTPAWTHQELIEEIRERSQSEVEVVSDLMVPCETPADSRLVAAARAARPTGREYGSPTGSDWVWFGERDVVKCGPGTSARSHTPDEFVDVDEVREARTFYAALARAYASS
jgi:acetylornithine deacetylase